MSGWPKNVEIVKGGDLTSSFEPVIVHQGNCTSVGASGLARALFDKYPYAYCYGQRRTAGTIVAKEHPSLPTVITLFAQLQPGTPTVIDSEAHRLAWFKECLCKMLLLACEKKYVRIAMPLRIGCGLAGGNVAQYETMLRYLAMAIEIRLPHCTLALYDYDAK